LVWFGDEKIMNIMKRRFGPLRNQMLRSYGRNTAAAPQSAAVF